jgi:hypothetical protein
MAVRILTGIAEYVRTSHGDIRNLKPPFAESRLRIGD